MRSALFAVLLAGSTVGVLAVEPATLAPFPALVPLFSRAGSRVGLVDGVSLGRAAPSGCADLAGESRGDACRRQAALSGHDRVWLRSYLDSLPRPSRDGSGPFVPEMHALDPGAFVTSVANRRGTEAHAGSASSPSVPSGLPRFEPSTEKPRTRWRLRASFGDDRKNPYLPRGLPAGILP